MSQLDFQAILDGMNAGSTSSDPIRSIYDIIPCYDAVQQHLLFQAFYFIEKYGLDDMRNMFVNFEHIMSKNKNLSFLGSQNLKSLLAAYTQNELVRGVKVSAVNDVSANAGIQQG